MCNDEIERHQFNSQFSDLVSSLVQKVFGVEALKVLESAIKKNEGEQTKLCLNMMKQCVESLDSTEDIDRALKRLKELIKERTE